MDREKVESLLSSWKRRTLKGIDSHYASERYYKKINKMFGIPTIILAVIITSVSFVFIGKEIPLWGQLVVGFASLFQVVLASLHTWLKYSETAQNHHEAGSDYASARRQIELLETDLDNVTREQLNDIAKQLADISKRSPVAPGRIWKLTQEAYGGHGTADGEILLERDTVAEQS